MKKRENKDESPEKTRQSRTLGEPSIGEYSDISKYDFSSKTKAKRAFSVTKLQTSLIAKSGSAPDIHNFQFMQDQFDRRNCQINRILSQIDPIEKHLDQETIKQETYRKIKLCTKDFKLHQFLKPSFLFLSL